MRNKDDAKILYYAKKIKAIQLLGSKCENCGENNIFVLEFHHKNRDDKEINISKIRECRWSTIEKEIKKCKLLCGNCHSELHFNENLSYDKRRNTKNILVEIKGKKCEKCGYEKCNGALTFHHKNGNENKIFNISNINERLNNIEEINEKIIQEIEKCALLCRNCHLIEHVDLDFFEKNKVEIYFKVKNYREIKSKVSRDKVLDLYLIGIKPSIIAKKLNVAKSTISGCLKELKDNGRLTD